MSMEKHDINSNLQPKSDKQEKRSLLGGKSEDYAYNINKKLEDLAQQDGVLNHEDIAIIKKFISDPKYRGIVNYSTLNRAQRDFESMSTAEKANLNPWIANDYKKREELNKIGKYFKDEIIGK